MGSGASAAAGGVAAKAAVAGTVATVGVVKLSVGTVRTDGELMPGETTTQRESDVWDNFRTNLLRSKIEKL